MCDSDWQCVWAPGDHPRIPSLELLCLWGTLLPSGTFLFAIASSCPTLIHLICHRSATSQFKVSWFSFLVSQFQKPMSSSQETSCMAFGQRKIPSHFLDRATALKLHGRAIMLLSFGNHPTILLVMANECHTLKTGDDFFWKVWPRLFLAIAIAIAHILFCHDGENFFLFSKKHTSWLPCL